MLTKTDAKALCGWHGKGSATIESTGRWCEAAWLAYVRQRMIQCSLVAAGSLTDGDGGSRPAKVLRTY